MRSPARSIRILITATLVAVIGAGCSSPEATNRTSGSSVEIDVVNIAYKPATLRVASGSEVVWTNLDDDVRHTVTSGRPGDAGVPGVSEATEPEPDGTFDGDLPDDSTSFRFTFEDTGTYPYFCRVHPSMTAEVVVE
ncbi:MAG: cupredoxin domain-containing protein [Actinomycetota bacterium]